MEIDFTGKVVLVTGASAGIGEAIALLFAKCGARMALVGRKEANLRQVAARCQRERGQPALEVLADLSTDEGVEVVAKTTLEHYGRLDVLVNNAAVGSRVTIQDTDMETFDRVFNLNVRGVYNLTRLLVPELIKTKGNIVNISSVISTMVIVGTLPYAMSKAALDHFTRTVAAELAPKGVRVNTVSPGITVSNMVQELTGCSEQEYEAYLRRSETEIPMGKVCVGEDVARMVVHLASDLSRLVTGTVVPVDGGIRFKGSNNVLLNGNKKV